MDLKSQERNSRLRGNIIDISIHWVVTIVCISLIYAKTANIAYVAIFLLGSIFIDVDHLIDHFLFSRNKFSLRDFFSSNHIEAGRIYIIFHSWELNIALLVSAFIFKSTGLLLLSIALTTHLAIDTIKVKKIWPYFIAYRIANKFDKDIFFR